MNILENDLLLNLAKHCLASLTSQCSLTGQCNKPLPPAAVHDGNSRTNKRTVPLCKALQQGGGGLNNCNISISCYFISFVVMLLKEQAAFILQRKIQFTITVEFTDRDCGDVCCCRRSLVAVQWRTSAAGHVTHHVAYNHHLTHPLTSHHHYGDDDSVVHEA